MISNNNNNNNNRSCKISIRRAIIRRNGAREADNTNRLLVHRQVISRSVQCNATQRNYCSRTTERSTPTKTELSVDLRCDKGGGREKERERGEAQSGIADGMELKRNRFSKLKRDICFDSTCFWSNIKTSADPGAERGVEEKEKGNLGDEESTRRDEIRYARIEMRRRHVSRSINRPREPYSIE